MDTNSHESEIAAAENPRAALDPSRSMLQQLRERHPIALGSIIRGKKVVMTCYVGWPMHIAVFRLEGEDRYRSAESKEVVQ